MKFKIKEVDDNYIYYSVTEEGKDMHLDGAVMVNDDIDEVIEEINKKVQFHIFLKSLVGMEHDIEKQIS